MVNLRNNNHLLNHNILGAINHPQMVSLLHLITGFPTLALVASPPMLGKWLRSQDSLGVGRVGSLNRQRSDSAAQLEGLGVVFMPAVRVRLVVPPGPFCLLV